VWCTSKTDNNRIYDVVIGKYSTVNIICFVDCCVSVRYSPSSV